MPLYALNLFELVVDHERLEDLRPLFGESK